MIGRVLKIAVHLVVLSPVCLGLIGPVQRAAATQFIQIPAVSFVLRCAAADCPTAGSSQVGEESQGLLLNAQGTYFAPVIFPNLVERVCRFVLWARDNDPSINVTARLMRKPLYTTNAFAPPELMAQVSSSGSSANLRVFSTASITAPLPTYQFVYYVELEAPGETLEIAGVRIQTQSTCP
jgi:hypothetical protein